MKYAQKQKTDEQDFALGERHATLCLKADRKKRWSYFIRKVYETDPLTCPKCQGEMRIISFIDQLEVIKEILKHLGLWEESHAPPKRDPAIKEIAFDLSYSLSQRLIRLRWKLI